MAYRNKLTSAGSSYKIRWGPPAGLQLLASVEFNTKNPQQGIVRPAEIFLKIRMGLQASIKPIHLQF